MFRWIPQTEATTRLSRREALRAGLLSIGGLTLADLFRLQAVAAAPRKDTAVIMLFVHGGPSHLETYDPKPLASADIRGPFMPIGTKVAGMQICEHLPKHAEIADKFTLIRSCCHDEADHFAGHRRFLSGYGKLKQGFANAALRRKMPHQNEERNYRQVVACKSGESLAFKKIRQRTPSCLYNIPDAARNKHSDGNRHAKRHE